MTLAKVRDLCIEAGRSQARGDHANALSLAQQAVAICRDGLGDRHYAYGMCLTALGWVSPPAEARLVFAEAALRARLVVPTDFENASTILKHVRDFHLGQGDAAAALGIQRELVDWHQEHLGFDHPRYFGAKAELERMA